MMGPEACCSSATIHRSERSSLMLITPHLRASEKASSQSIIERLATSKRPGSHVSFHQHSLDGSLVVIDALQDPYFAICDCICDARDLNITRLDLRVAKHLASPISSNTGKVPSPSSSRLCSPTTPCFLRASVPCRPPSRD